MSRREIVAIALVFLSTVGTVGAILGVEHYRRHSRYSADW